jgi:carbon storage regulator CsrA
MLVLSRKENEEILIGENIRIRVVKIGGGRTRIGIVAPREVNVRRAEVVEREHQPQVVGVAD